MNPITNTLLYNILALLKTRLEELEAEIVPTEVTRVLGYVQNYGHLDEVLTQDMYKDLLEKIQLRYRDFEENIEIYVVDTVMAVREWQIVIREFNSPTTLKLIVDELKDVGLIDYKALGQFNYKYDYYDIVKREDLEKLSDLVEYQIKFANP